MNVSRPRQVATWFRPELIVNIVGLVVALGTALWLADRLMLGREKEALATVVLIAVMVIILVRPRFGFLLWIMMAPFARLLVLKMGGGLPDLGLNRLAILCTLFAIMAQVAIGRRRLARPTVVDLTAALFVIGMALSIPASRLGTVGGVQFLFDFVVIPLLVYFCARELLRGPKGMEQTALVLAIIGAMLGFFAVREQLTNLPFLNPISHRWTYGSGIWKITSFFGVPAIMSLTLVMTVPAILVAATRPRPRARRFLWSAALIMTLAGILQTYVRAGWLAAVVALIMVLILTPATRRYSLRLTLVAVLLIAILSGGLIPRMFGVSEEFISQTSSVSGEIIPQTSTVSGGFINSNALEDRLTSEGPIDYRMEALQVGLQIAARSPIFGLGLGNFGIGARDTDWAFSKSLGVVAGAWLVDPHNMYIYVLTSAGLVGLVTFLLLLGSVGFRGIRGWRRAGRLPGGDQGRWAVLLATLSAYAVFAYTFDAIHAQLATMLLFLVVGTVLAPPQDTASAETQA